jgi:hypothetical protein
MKVITSDRIEQPGGNPGLTAHQMQFLCKFNQIDADSQRYVLAVLHGEYERAVRPGRSHLRLVGGGAA